jgi:hypothetical protein
MGQVITNQWYFIPAPINSILLWTHCATEHSFNTYAEAAAQCDSMVTLAYCSSVPTERSEVMAITTFNWHTPGHSIAFSFWLNPNYRRKINKESFKLIINRLKEVLIKGGVKVAFSMMNWSQFNIAHLCDGQQIGIINNLFGNGANGYVFAWQLGE